jgi:hypothetical protein
VKTALSKCPVCDGELTVTRLHCETCDTSIDGRFANGAFAGLTPEQLDFIETFVRCEGKITRALGYEPGKEEASDISDEKRRSVLEELDSGKISAEEAMRVLNGEE